MSTTDSTLPHTVAQTLRETGRRPRNTHTHTNTNTVRTGKKIRREQKLRVCQRRKSGTMTKKPLNLAIPSLVSFRGQFQKSRRGKQQITMVSTGGKDKKGRKTTECESESEKHKRKD